MPEPIKIVFLGGLGEIGRNCACIEAEEKILVIDVGLMFPDADMPGVDLVLPDFTYLIENADRVVGAVITHGHEDHMGGLSFLLRDISFPIYGSALTIGLASNRIEEAGVMDRTTMVTVADGERVDIGPFNVEFVPVTHSVPHGFALIIRTPQGVIIHSGDFKLDMTPVDGRRTDLARIGAVADSEGVRLLLADSTNAEEPGFTRSEKSVGEVLTKLFAVHKDKRIIVTCFASHIHRVQQVARAAVDSGRKIATLGRSMANNVALSRSLGLLDVPTSAFVEIEQVASMDPRSVCVISTGSQGEPMSALALMASGEHKWLTVGHGDLVIMSSHAIPGNEFDVNKVIDGLYRTGAEVIHSGIEDVHVSGHAMQGELATLMSISKPEYFIPVHGEFRHMVNHARLAERMGMASANVLICEDGDVVELSDNGLAVSGEVPANYLFVDGIVGDVSHGVLRDRRVLAAEGMIVVIVGVDNKVGEIVTGPEIITKGWIYGQESEDLLHDAREELVEALAQLSIASLVDHDSLRKHLRSTMGKIVSKKTKRKPMIVPVVMEV